MFRVLICVIYTIIDRYACIEYLGTEAKKISGLRLGCTLKTKHENMDYENLFGIGIPDIFLNMLSCQGFLKNNESIVIFKCPNRMSEYCFNKGFIQLTWDEDHLKTLPVWVKDIVGAELKVNSDLVMLCYTTTTSSSNTLKDLYISKDYHSSYSTDNFNNEKEAMDRLFSTYVKPQIKDISSRNYSRMEVKYWCCRAWKKYDFITCTLY